MILENGLASNIYYYFGIRILGLLKVKTCMYKTPRKQAITTKLKEYNYYAKINTIFV